MIYFAGRGTCRPSLSCRDYRMPFLSSETGASCDCQEGRTEIEGKCEIIFTQNGCSGGNILIPITFNLNSHTDDVCPPMFTCKPAGLCQGYGKTVEEIKQTVLYKSRLDEVNFMKSLVCNTVTKTICCPEFKHNTFLTPSVLLASLKSASDVSCTANPCLAGRWPWVGQDGLNSCVEANKNVNNCETELNLFEGQLTCIGPFDVRITETQQNCGRRRRFANGRCVRIYG